MRRTSRGGWLSRLAAKRQKKWVWLPEFDPQNRKPGKSAVQRAGYAMRIPGRARGPDMPDTAPHAAELAFYFRWCSKKNKTDRRLCVFVAFSKFLTARTAGALEERKQRNYHHRRAENGCVRFRTTYIHTAMCVCECTNRKACNHTKRSSRTSLRSASSCRT